MGLLEEDTDVKYLVDNLNFKEKVERSLQLIEEALDKFGDNLVVANSLGKDSVAVWDLAKKVSDDIPGFIVATRFFPQATKDFMKKEMERYPELEVYTNDEEIPDEFYNKDPDECCQRLKVLPTRWAVEDMDVDCWVTGLRCTEGRTRTNYKEVEERDEGLIKLNPILLWKEREIWQYLALNNVNVNPLYGEGYRSLGCEPCTNITTDDNERAGRWVGTSKCGGECGIHTKPIRGEEVEVEDF